MTEQSESQLDTIVTWLEEGVNFQRVTALLGPAGSLQNRGDANGHQAEQNERQALNELAAAVNAARHQSMWEHKDAKQMLQRYLTLFRATATQALQPGFSLSRTDKVFGIKTIEDKLNSMCPHFMRLHALHRARKEIAAQENVRRDQVEEKEKKLGNATLRSALHQAKAIEASDQKKIHQFISMQPFQKATEGLQIAKKSAEDSITGNGYTLGSSSTEQGSVANEFEGQKTSSLKETAQKSGKKNRDVSEPSKVPDQPMDQVAEDETERFHKSLELIELASDGEEVPAESAKATSVTLGFRLRASKSASNVTANSRKRKLRRKNSLEEKSKAVPETVQFSKFANKQSTAVAPESTLTRKGTSSGNKLKPSEEMSGEGAPAIKGPSTTAALAQPEIDRHSPSKVRHEVQSSPSSQIMDTTFVAHRGIVQSSNVVTGPPVQSNQNSSAQHSLPTPDALPANAQVVSQRQQVFDKQSLNFPPGISKSDRSPSDQSAEKEAKCSTLSNHFSKQNDSLAFIEPPSDQAPLGATDRMPKNVVPNGNYSTKGSPAVSKAEGNNAKATFVTGYIPPLLTEPLSVDRDVNLERKRAFLRAKQLAFEQFRWVRENELQQLEVKLLQREIKTRKMRAQVEITLLRMYVRADIIQRMVLAGASAEVIAERLKLL